MKTIEQNTKQEPQAKPFAYSVIGGLVSPITPIERVYSRFPILSTHCLTQAQIRELQGVV